MSANIERFKADFEKLRERGVYLECAMILDLRGEAGLREALGSPSDDEFALHNSKIPTFLHAYEAWYSEALVLLKQLMPDRVETFRRLYERPANRKSIDYVSYVIEDYIVGLKSTRGFDVVVDKNAALPRLQQQTAIFAAASKRFKSSLFEVRQILQADLFDSEIDASRELLKKGFNRAAGAIAGVVLEKHLSQVASDHQVKMAKKHPSIGDWNELLKSAAITDIPQWRFISMLADIRNLCDHNKDREPTADQVSELIDGVNKIIKTIS